METVQEFTDIQNASNEIEAKAKREALLKYQQEVWIDYNALGGLIIEADGSFRLSKTEVDRNGNRKQYSVSDLADELGVSRQTLYNWTKAIPDFWERVRARRKTLGSGARVQKVWNGIFLKAAAGNPQAAAMFLANFDDDFHMPTEKVQHDLGDGWSQLARSKSKIIEGETVDDVSGT